MQEKWQHKCEEALKHWPKWKESADKARARTKARFGNVALLLDREREEFEALKDTFDNDPIGELFKKNEKRFEIMEVLEKPAHDFVSKEIHFSQLTSADLYWAFTDIWIDSVCPELKVDAKSDFEHYNESLEGPDTPRRKIGVLNGKTEGRTWHLIRWFSDEATPPEVAEFIQKRQELFSDDRVRPHAGGRPREEFRIDIESIICYVLRKVSVPNMKEPDVAKLFDYSDLEINAIGDPASRLIRRRVKRGREIINECNRLAKNGQ